MIQLLLETATDVCSVAVARDGVVLAEHTAAEAHQHSSHLTLFIQQIMAEAGLKMTELQEVVLSDGPGSYTSLRVGGATAKGFCVALPGLKLRAVSTLGALAQAADAQGVILATINSRRGEVYGQLFSRARTQVQSEDKEAMESGLWTSPQNILLTEEDWYDQLTTAAGTTEITVVGGGQARVLEHLPAGATLRATTPEHCAAVHLLAPALAPEEPGSSASRLVDPASYEPFYLNPPFVTKSKKKLLGR